MKYVYKYDHFGDYQFTIVLPRNNLTKYCMGSDKKLECELVECDDRVRALIFTLFKTLLKKKFDLVHSHGFTSGACASILVKLFSLQHIMTAHDVILEQQFSGKIGLIKKFLVSFLFNRVDIILAVTHDAQANFNEMLPGVTRPEKRVIVNGIDIEMFDNLPQRPFRQELGLGDNVFLVGFLGRLMSQKGFKYLVEAIASIYRENEAGLKPVLLVFADDGFIREEKENVTQMKLEEAIHFLPRVDSVGEVINGLDIVAMPSLWEACGLLAMEALVIGKPLIASNCIGLREVIEGSPTFVVEPRNHLALAEAICTAMNDTRDAEFMSYRETARRRFTAEKTTRGLAGLYREILG